MLQLLVYVLSVYNLFEKKHKSNSKRYLEKLFHISTSHHHHHHLFKFLKKKKDIFNNC